MVIVRCPSCKGRHLLADRLGWFGEDSSIEDTLARHGQGQFCCILYIWACFNLQRSAEKKCILCSSVLLQRCLALSYNVSCLLKLLKILQM